MGFLDRAKAHLPSGFGDETVRVVNYAKEGDAAEEKPKVEKAPKPERPPREPKAPKVREPKPMKPRREPKEEPPAPKPEKVLPPEPEEEPSAFVLDEKQKNFYQEQQEKYEAAQAARSEDLTSLKDHENKIKDVLEVLQIPATFAIESDVFLPEDLDDLVFDLQAPYGFEQGQVNTFVERTKITVARYVAFLRLRNEHVAKLASVVDRLQVDANNLRFQNEISSGINVMPTADSEDLENQLLEAKLKCKRLEDQLRLIDHGDALSSEERKTFDDLQDNFSMVQRENGDLKEEVYHLKNRLAALEEDADSGERELPLAFTEDLESAETCSLSPEAEEEIELDLPSLEDTMLTQPAQVKPSSASAFFVDEEDDSAFASSSIELLDDNYRTSNASAMLEEEDDDDPLDDLMRDWNKQ